MKVVIGVLIFAIACQACQDTGCPAGQSCNPYTNECVIDAPPPLKPAAWLGESPDFCDRKPSDCALFALEYDISHPKGDGEFCSNGTKIRCILPEYKPQLEDTPENELRVVTYNLFERSFQISWDGQRERTCRLVLWLVKNHPDIDVITFQEAFMGGCFAESLDLRTLLKYYNFPHFTKTIESDEVFSNGGIFIASRWPILEEDMHVYNASDPDSWDWFAAKGVSYAKIQKKNRIYHVTSTHMQASGQITLRVDQCEETRDFLGNKSISLSEPIIYSGDFNLDLYDERELELMRQCMVFLDGEIPENGGKMNATADPATNDLLSLIRPGSKANWIDFVIPNVVHNKPIEASQIILKPADDEPFPVCWCQQCIPLDPDYIYPDDEDCERVERIRDLSDHFPVLGVFKYN